MSAFTLFWETNMAAVTSCENTLYLGCDDAAQFWESVSVKVKLLSYS